MPDDVAMPDPAMLLRRWRDDWPEVRPVQGNGVFELGLCMAGAVSAGAYTAGVLDYLIEALDALQAERDARAADGRPPLHRPVLTVLGGASAGGMCAAIGAIFLDTKFPPVRAETPPEERRRNPLWRAWVEDVDIAAMLGAGDVADGRPLASLLDCSVLERIVDTLLAERATMAPCRRPWLANPFRAVLTLANLRGVPYALRFDGSGFRHWMTHHADHVDYTIALDEAVEGAPGDPSRIGELPLDRTAPAQRGGFKAVALGTGSFPVALAPRVLARDAGHYLYRAALTPLGPFARKLPVEPFPAWATLVQPAWQPQAPDRYSALCVDGGAMNNEPLDLVRRMISGYVGRPPQRVAEAQRAILMIDPFVNPGKLGPEADRGLVGSLLPLVNALIANSRFKPEDLALAADPTIGSRFLIAPSRGAKWEAEGAIAAGHLGGFLGFFARAYREHDFFLGRRNARAFLCDHFRLPAGNPVFAEGRWGEAERARWGRTEGGTEWLPVVPLCGALATREEPLPAWPAGAFDPESVRPLVAARTKVAGRALRDTIIEMALSSGGVWPWVGRNALRAVLPLLLPRAVDAAMAQVTKAVGELDRKGQAKA